MLYPGGCGVAPDAVQAEARLFLPLSLEFLDSYTLPKQAIEDLPVGGISDLTYDRQRDVYYAVTDDRRSPRFYTMHLTIVPGQEGIGIAKAEIVGMTRLRTSGGETYDPQLLDPEGIALSPRQTLFISSEGVLSSQSPL
ncbi:esterase-like activity of phytase family protein [Synechocystis sp. B12]|nr:esterase-like activity of phytase family protein [Synechocystis sp. B12]